jgi:replicative DNA helicase
VTEQERLERYRAEAQPIREAINSRPLTDFYRLERSKGGLYVCPICGSGTGPNKTGALSVRKTDNRVTCFSGGCFGDKGQDTLGALQILMEGEPERKIFAYCGYHMSDNRGETTNEARTKHGKTQLQQEAAEASTASTGAFTASTSASIPRTSTSFIEEIERCTAALEGSEGESYLLGRGISIETMKRYKLGYDAKLRCVTIPYNPRGSYYSRRFIQPGARAHDNLRGITMPLFNQAALYAGDVCFIVESPLCAISIGQAGGAAVAISGTGGKGRLMDQLGRMPTTAALVLCLDNDEAGRKATADISEALEKMGVFHVNGTLAIMGAAQDPEAETYRKDPNDVLQRDGEEVLRQAVEETAEETLRHYNMTAQEAEEERQAVTGAGMIDSFLQAVQTRQYEPMPTGIADIDKALDGGFMRQWLVLLGAAPGVGKTAFAQWIFEGMAKRGTSCLYLNLEMSRDQILARSLARIIAANTRHRIKTTTILQGYRWTEAERAAILEAAEEYKVTIAPRMIYNPDGVTANLDSILAYIEMEAQRAEKADLPAPCVILDYLQIVSGEPREDAANLIKRAVSALKGYAVRHNTLVFVIMAHNRTSNSKGIVTMESGRDTSALEYSADLQLALAYTACLKRNGQDKKDPEDLTGEERQRLTLVILKGRFGGVGREVDLQFDGETMTYKQMAQGFSDPQAIQKPRLRF